MSSGFPMVQKWDPATSTPVTGSLAFSTSSTGTSSNFTPNLVRAIWVNLSGTWAGTVTLQRSIDNGVTWYGITSGTGITRGVWTTNVNAAITEETVYGAMYRLSIVLTSGTVNFVINQ